MKFQSKFLLPLFCSLAINSFAQTSMNLSLKAGLLRGREIVKSKDIDTHDIGSYKGDANSNFSIASSFPLKRNFRLGAEIGLIYFKSFIDYRFTYADNSIEDYNGRYQINQAFLTIIPEYRIIDWWYINAGAGLYWDYNSYFKSGTRTGGSSIAGLKFKRNIPFGAFIGTGFCPNLTKELGLLAEVRYTVSPASISAPERVGIGYGAVNFNVGLMFNLGLSN